MRGSAQFGGVSLIIPTRNVRIRWRPQTNTMPVETKGPLLCFGVFVVYNIGPKLKTKSYENYWKEQNSTKRREQGIYSTRPIWWVLDRHNQLGSNHTLGQWFQYDYNFIVLQWQRWLPPKIELEDRDEDRETKLNIKEETGHIFDQTYLMDPY